MELSVNNNSGPVRTNITVAATGQASGPTRLQRSVGQTSGLPVGRASGPAVAASRGCRDWQVGDLPHAASLLWMTVPAGANAGTYFSAYDGNGNVMALVNAADGSVAARYEYGPFGELIRATGPMAKVNPFRFSTKYQDEETGLVYYGYRYYDPSTGRWVNSDPMEEKGGLNLFGFVENDPSNRVDPLGKDYYIVSVDGITCIRHRVMIGDDGFGGHYWIELYPDTKNVGMLKECQRRICGKGIINYLHAKGSAKDKFDELKKDNDAGAKLVKHVKTTKEQDQVLGAGAAAYGAKETTTYCFILNDCWSIGGNVRETCAQQALCKKLNDFLIKELFKLTYPNH